MSRRQGIYWGPNTMAFENSLDMKLFWDMWGSEGGTGQVKWMIGQQEIGESGYHHWQFFVLVASKKSLNQMKGVHATVSWRLSDSVAAEAYVLKEDSRVDGTMFEFGTKPFKRNSKTDWQQVWDLVVSGKKDDIEPGIKIRNWHALNSIERSVVLPIRRPLVEVEYYWGPTGTGKSHAADEKYPDAYWKISSNKWWCGYCGEDTVIIDELSTECISISKLLTWFDKYKCYVEVKGGTIGLRATKFIITSNLSPEALCANELPEHKLAFARRVNAINFNEPWQTLL